MLNYWFFFPVGLSFSLQVKANVTIDNVINSGFIFYSEYSSVVDLPHTPAQPATLFVLIKRVFLFAAPRIFMLYSTKKDIRRILFNSSDNLDVVLPVRGLSDVLVIDYDINSHLVFWIDGTTKTIRCSFQNGTNAKIIKLDAGAVPYDLAIDSYGQQVFWTDAASNSIKVYSLKNKANLGVVFREKDVYPRSIVLHPQKG